MYVCKTLFTDASLVNKIVGFHKWRQTIKKEKSKKIFTKKKRKENIDIACICTRNWCDPVKY